ncbi:MAG: hypothetical protein ACJAVY_002386 [Marinoscillum sp.]|jgi:hypothetical protein
MKNITLSIPDELLAKARSYASERGTSLNEMIRTHLKQTVGSKNELFAEKLAESQKRIQLDTINWKFDRDDIYER